MLEPTLRRFFFVVLFLGVFVTTAFMIYEEKLKFLTPVSSYVTTATKPLQQIRSKRLIKRHKTFHVNDSVHEVCNASYEGTFSANLNYIRGYNLSSALPYMKKLKLRPRLVSTEDVSNVTVPIFVTACSSNHFKENMGLLENIEQVVRPAFRDLKVIVFDLGLTQTERQQLSIACRCTVRSFPFSDLPDYFSNIKGCAWKPVVMQLVVKEYPFVMWMDSSVRFVTGDLQPLFDKAISSGIILNKRQRLYRELYVREQTNEQTFQTLKEPPCLYDREPMVEAGLVLLYAKDYVIEGILTPWTMCSLVTECMWTSRPILEILKCPRVASIVNHRCHRYDQSVLNILMKRLFHHEMPRHLVAECQYAYFRNRVRCTKYMGKTYD